MNTDFSKWIGSLDAFAGKIESTLDEIRGAKAQMQQAKSEFIEFLEKGQYYRDDERIIISAPEIIIGNLMKDGTLITTQPSKVIIRSNEISLEGVGTDATSIGKISQKASKIENICIDPGIDGLEKVVKGTSEYSIHACNIGMLSEDTTEGVFASQPIAGKGNIMLSADNQIDLEAAKPGTNKAKKIDEISNDNSSKGKDKANLEEKYKKQKKQIEDTEKYLQSLLNYKTDIFNNSQQISANCLDIESLQEEIENTVRTLSIELSDCGRILSEWAEVSRQIKGLKNTKNIIDKEVKNYEKNGNGTSVNILAESTNIRAIDADGNIQKSDDAGLHVLGKNVEIKSNQEDDSVLDNSHINLLTQEIRLSTENYKREGENINYTSEGNIHVVSKNIVMESVDYERKKGEERKEKALTKDGCIKMRAENMELSSYDTEGKASGKFSLNSKNISLKAMDVDKEKLTDKEMAKDSKMLLLTDKIYAGDPEEKSLTQQIQLAADKVGIFAKTTAEIQQDEAKAAVQLDGGNISLSGSKTNLFGETTVNGKTTFKADTVQGKATVDNIEIKTSLKSPKTSEGIAVPSSPSSEKISTKLKEDKDINKQEEKS